MAKARRKARKARKPARRAAGKGKKRVVTAKLKGGRRVAKPRATRARKKGVIAGAMQAVAEAVSLRTRLGGRNTFEDV